MSLRVELQEWCDQHIQELLPDGFDQLALPVVEDFVLCYAIGSATDGPGEGVIWIGSQGSGNGNYRTVGLLRTVLREKETPEDDE